MTDDQMKEVVDAVNEMREDINHASEGRKIYQDIIKQHEQREIDLKRQLEDCHRDYHERCSKCGKKLRSRQEWPSLYSQPIWMVEPQRYYFGDNTIWVTLDTNSGS